MKFNTLVDNVWEADRELQESYLKIVASEIRKSPGLEEVFKQNKFIFVPSDDYLPNILGDWITDPSLDIYTKNGECKEYAKVWIPLYDFNDDIIAFAFYDCGLVDRGNVHPIKYRMQRLEIPWNKYINIRPHTYKKALQESVLFVNDGFMDKFQLEKIGVPATSIYGSNLSEYRKHFLTPMNNIVLCRDNDNAGELLEEKFNKLLPNSIILTHNVGKDMDDYLKLHPRGKENLLEFYEIVKGGRFKLKEYFLPS